MKTKLSLVLLCILVFAAGRRLSAQQLALDLYEVIRLAQGEAPDVLLTRTRLSNSYWQYQSYKANYRPLISLNGQLPTMDRIIVPVTQPDGTDLFLPRSLMSNSLNLGISQDIALTGGSVFLGTGLRRLDIFRTTANQGSVSWLSTPLTIGISQPFYRFNTLRWDKRTEPLRYEEARSRYSEEMERIAYDAVVLFFEVYRSQQILQAAYFDKANADTLLEISKGRFEVGRIAETELLQIELSSMNAGDAIAEAQLNLQTSTERLRNFLGIKTAVTFDVTLPEDLPKISIPADLALSYARRYRSETVAFQRRLIEADREVDRAIKSSGFSLDLVGSVGLSQTAPDLNTAYRSPLDQEQVAVSLQVPIADWGKARSRRETARSNRELVRMNVEQEQVSFEREILLRVQQFELITNRVGLASRAYEVAVKRQELTRQRYLIGKIGITDLNIALSEQDRARRGYIEAQRAFWVALYEIRGLTLYDFAAGRPLIREE